MHVQSFLGGQWVDGEGSNVWSDPTTGEVFAHTATGGLDLAGAFAYARETGLAGMALMTFHDRANILRACGKLIDANKEALYELSFATGATRADSWIDIEGGAGTLFSYGSKGTNELPNAKLVVDGPAEVLARDGSFLGQHVYTPRQGVAVQINAFNFPVWGMLEKFAPAFLAGMPVIAKAAEQTCFLTEAMVRLLVDAELLPAGALQLVCAPGHDILDHVASQDVVAFTGSAATARSIRAHERVLACNPRLGMETDSINCSILGPDVIGNGTMLDLFVNEVHDEISTKAGQKCTAIRRVMVPTASADAVAAALQEKLNGVPLGDPRDESVRIGPLATPLQKERVVAAIDHLAKDCEVVMDGRHVAGVSEDSAFVGPTVLRARGVNAAAAVHATEAFGPVCTIIEYNNIDELCELVGAGDGALVGSLFSADQSAIVSIITRLAPLHGRLLVVNEENAKTSTGHGSPLPVLVHGGPGRAGGGEELGGIRGVHHYMQRTALQGSPTTLAAISGRWMKGAPEIDAGVHPFRIPFHELEIGTSFNSEERLVTLEDIEAFAHLTGDIFYAHMDEEAARRNPLFGGRVAHGYFLVSAAAGLFVDPPYGPVLGNYGIDNLRFTRPVKPGTRIKVRLTCKSKSFRASRGYGEVSWDTEITDQDGNVCAAYDVLTMVSELAVPDGGEPA